MALRWPAPGLVGPAAADAVPARGGPQAGQGHDVAAEEEELELARLLAENRQLRERESDLTASMLEVKQQLELAAQEEEGEEEFEGGSVDEGGDELDEEPYAEAEEGEVERLCSERMELEALIAELVKSRNGKADTTEVSVKAMLGMREELSEEASKCTAVLLDGQLVAHGEELHVDPARLEAAGFREAAWARELRGRATQSMRLSIILSAWSQEASAECSSRGAQEELARLRQSEDEEEARLDVLEVEEAQEQLQVAAASTHSSGLREEMNKQDKDDAGVAALTAAEAQRDFLQKSYDELVAQTSVLVDEDVVAQRVQWRALPARAEFASVEAEHVRQEADLNVLEQQLTDAQGIEEEQLAVCEEQIAGQVCKARVLEDTEEAEATEYCAEQREVEALADERAALDSASQLRFEQDAEHLRKAGHAVRDLLESKRERGFRQAGYATELREAERCSLELVAPVTAKLCKLTSEAARQLRERQALELLAAKMACEASEDEASEEEDLARCLARVGPLESQLEVLWKEGLAAGLSLAEAEERAEAARCEESQRRASALRGLEASGTLAAALARATAEGDLPAELLAVAAGAMRELSPQALAACALACSARPLRHAALLAELAAAVEGQAARFETTGLACISRSLAFLTALDGATHRAIAKAVGQRDFDIVE